MLELCSYKPFGLLCSLLYSVLNELQCQMNKPCLNQVKTIHKKPPVKVQWPLTVDHIVADLQIYGISETYWLTDWMHGNEVEM